MTAELTFTPKLTPREALSPFLPWSEAEVAAADIPEESPGRPPSAFIELLGDPRASVLRILDPATRPAAVVSAIGAIAIGQASFTAVTMAANHGLAEAAFAAVLAPIALLVAIAAALGPSYGASLIVAARLPIGRLVASLLSAVATGSLVLIALAPLPYAATIFDYEWAGPLSVLGALALSALASGARARRLLLTMAEEVLRIADPNAELDASQRFRVGVVARVSMVMIAFALSLSFWIFEPFV